MKITLVFFQFEDVYNPFCCWKYLCRYKQTILFSKFLARIVSIWILILVLKYETERMKFSFLSWMLKCWAPAHALPDEISLTTFWTMMKVGGVHCPNCGCGDEQFYWTGLVLAPISADLALSDIFRLDLLGKLFFINISEDVMNCHHHIHRDHDGHHHGDSIEMIKWWHSLAALRGQVGERQNHGCGPNPLLALGITIISFIFERKLISSASWLISSASYFANVTPLWTFYVHTVTENQ